MSRSGYQDYDDCEGDWGLRLGQWRGRVASAIRGRRGQKLLIELRDALDAMPEKRLIAEELKTEDGEVCALGALGAKRGIDMECLDPEDPDQIGKAFDIAPCLAQEIVYYNDEVYDWGYVDGKREMFTPEQRWEKMRAWVEKRIKQEPALAND